MRYWSDIKVKKNIKKSELIMLGGLEFVHSKQTLLNKSKIDVRLFRY